MIRHNRVVNVNTYSQVLDTPRRSSVVRVFLLALPIWSYLFLLILSDYFQAPTIIRIAVVIYSVSVFILLYIWLIEKSYFENIGWFFLLFGHLFWFAAPSLYQAVVPGVWYGDWIRMTVSDRALLKACGLISLFLSMNGIGYHVAKRASSNGFAPNINLFFVDRKHRLYTVLACFAIGLIPYVLFGGGLSNIVSGVLAGRSEKPWALSPEGGYEANSMQTIAWLTRAFLVSSGLLGGCYFIIEHLFSFVSR